MRRFLDGVIYARRPFVVLLHAMLVVLSNAGAFWLRFDGEVPSQFVALAIQLMPWLVAVRLVVFVPFRLFEGLWRYTSLWDLRNIVLGVVVSTALFYPIAVAVATFPRYPRSIFIIDAVLLLCL